MYAGIGEQHINAILFVIDLVNSVPYLLPVSYIAQNIMGSFFVISYCKVKVINNAPFALQQIFCSLTDACTGARNNHHFVVPIHGKLFSTLLAIKGRNK